MFDEEITMEFFPRVLGNERTKNRIGTAIKTGRAPHAFLIDGERGSGKLTLALDIAASLNCEEAKDTLPCCRCNTCRRIYEGSYLDVKVLAKSEDKATIGVSEIKEFRQDMFLSSTEAHTKVYIIKDAERMTPEAQNALLIVLEEPPKNVVIILLCCGTDRILTTIKSRTQYIPMQRFNKSELENHLKSISEEAVKLSRTDREKFGVILTVSDGVIGTALSLLDPARERAAEEDRADIIEFISALDSRAGYLKLYNAVSALPTKRAELSDALEMIMCALSDIIVTKRDENANTIFFVSADEAIKAGEYMSLGFVLSVYDIVLKTHDDLSKNAGVSALMTTFMSKIKLLGKR